jgi:hypothetical protein
MVSESRGSGAVVSKTVTVAVPVITLALEFVHSAVMVLVPELTPEASPPAVMVATEGMLDSHVSCDIPVMFSVTPLLKVPRAVYCPVCPEAETDWEPGMIVIEVKAPPAPTAPVPVTVRRAVAETMPEKPVAVAVIVVTPADTPVATPEAFTVATAGVLEIQVT